MCLYTIHVLTNEDKSTIKLIPKGVLFLWFKIIILILIIQVTKKQKLFYVQVA